MGHLKRPGLAHFKKNIGLVHVLTWTLMFPTLLSLRIIQNRGRNGSKLY